MVKNKLKYKWLKSIKIFITNEMRKFQVVIMSSIILLLILILFLLVTLLFNKSILSFNAPKSIRLFVQAIATPKDFYNYLINEELDITKKGLIKRIEFKNKYTGKYDVGVLLDKMSDEIYFKPLSERYNLKLKIQIDFYLQNSLILSYFIENKYDPFIGRNDNGFSFFTYECPKDLAISKLITCELRIIEPDDELYNTYGPVKFYIRKMSDK
ncbi:MAG: hypothetical protein AB1498_13400 [bacterium]